MNFLQPWMLWSLPLVSLPVIIHLINQRRFQTVPWGAMQFLLAANRMSRGYAKIRQWLILLMRGLAIAGLIFAISRPLSSGWMGAAAGGRADVAIVLLDRSPSMQQRGAETAATKLQTGKRQLDEALQTLSPERIVLIDSTSLEPRELAEGEVLSELPAAGPSDASADMPAMLLRALDYVQENNLAQADIWICSDLRAGDWKPSDGRWASLREGFKTYENRLRFHLLAYPESAPDDLSVRATAVEMRASGKSIASTNEVARGGAASSAEVVISLEVEQPLGAARVVDETASRVVPITFELDGTRSVLEADLRGPKLEIQGHRIPVPGKLRQGWGRVSIPGDRNAADNDFYFVFDDPPPRRTMVVSDAPQVERPLRLAAGIAPVEDQAVEAVVRQEGTLDGLAWNELSLVLWHAPLPRGRTLDELTAWVDRGGRVIFFPPLQTESLEVFGVRFGDWVEATEPQRIANWRGDADLLGRTQSGQALPVGELEVRRHARLQGEFTTLASLSEETPLLVRAATERGGVYFCGTTPQSDDSNFAGQGVVLYVLVQRAAAAGAEALLSTGSYTAGVLVDEDAAKWAPVRTREEAISLEYPTTAGVYRREDTLLAINRSRAEDVADVLADEQLGALFGSLTLDRVNDAAGNLATLVREVWRLFLIGMMVALWLEAVLCVPRQSGSRLNDARRNAARPTTGGMARS